MNITINTVSDIEIAASYNSWLNRPAVRNVTLSHHKINTETGRKLENRVKYLFNDCGCIWGALVFVLTLLVVYNFYSFETSSFWKKALISAAVAVPSAFVAKLLALRWSYHCLYTTLNTLKEEMGS